MATKSTKPFDRLKYDPDFELHQTKLNHNENEIAFTISVQDDYTLVDAIPVATEFWNSRTDWFAKAQNRASKNELEHINNFLDNAPDLTQITKIQFNQALAVPSSIQLEMDDDQIWLELSYHSGLFGDHVVSVSIQLDDKTMDSDVHALY